MRIDAPTKTRYLFEFLFADVIASHDAVAFTKPGSAVRASEARSLRLAVDDELAKEGCDLASSRSVRQMLGAIDRVLGERLGGAPYEVADASDARYREQLARFSDITGLRPGVDEIDADHALPLSPWMPETSGYEVVRWNGIEILEIPGDAVADASAIGRSVEGDRRVRVRVGRGEPTPLAVDADATGLAALMPYMTSREYRDVIEWAPSSLPEGSDAVERAIAVLDGLRSAGVRYSISRDRRPGQIRARVEGTKIDVRVMDAPGQEAFIGRVYDDGAVTYLSTTANGPAASAGARTPTPAEAASLVKLAMGETVRDAAGEAIGSVGVYRRRVGGRERSFSRSYHTETSFGAVMDPTGDRWGNRVVALTKTTGRTAPARSFADEGEARAFLDEARAAAADAFASALDVDRVIEAAANGGADSIELSEEPDVAATQREYLSVLADGDDRSAADAVRERARDLIDRMFRAPMIDIVSTARWMPGSHGIYRNTDDIVAALRRVGATAEDVLGGDFYSDAARSRLVRFDPSTAVPMATARNPFTRRMGEVVAEALSVNAVEVDPDDVLVDASGVVRYAGRMCDRASTRDGEPSMREVSGLIGQIFAPDADGVVTTSFAGGADHAFVPGYEAVIVPASDGPDPGFAARTRLMGYERRMASAIRMRLRADCIAARSAAPGEDVGEPSSLNAVYRHVYGERYPVDFRERYLERSRSGDPDEASLRAGTLSAVLRTQASRVRYGNDVRDGSTINAAWRASAGLADAANDSRGDPWSLTGGTDMSLLGREADGYFDPIATTSTSTNQGIVRFLATGARVRDDGSIEPGDPSSRCALMESPIAREMSFDPFDRQCMTISNIMSASEITEPVGVAQMCLGGWTMDDSVVVSARFAAAHGIRDAAGGLRPLAAGDKISDLHGNKGVVSLVVDPDADPDEIRAAGLAEVTAWFSANPGLDVAMAPFPAVSRFNGGTAREAMTASSDLRAPDGSVVPGGMGRLRMIITDKSAEAKTHAYDEDEIRSGAGRKVSSQLAWCLGAKGADAILDECYGSNGGAVASVREYLNVCGLDMDETGALRDHWEPHPGERRRIIEIEQAPRSASGAIDRRAARDAADRALGRAGGFLAMPFPMFSTADGSVYPIEEGSVGRLEGGSDWSIESDLASTDGDGRRWAVPVMSAKLRSGAEFADGTTTVHDYTNAYMTMHALGAEYLAQRAECRAATDPSAAAKARARCADCVARARSAFGSISSSVTERRVESKRNMFREDLMGRRMPNSATAVWSADPRLGIDEIALSPGVAETIGAREGSGVLVWRDPALRDGALRWMRVRVDDRLIGCAVSPVMDKSFDGDFDGDTVGLLRLRTPEARACAEELFSVRANLLDPGVAPDASGDRPLYMQRSLDVRVAEHLDPSIADGLDALAREANEAARAYDVEGDIGSSELAARREAIVCGLTDVYARAFARSRGEAVVRFDSIASHVGSVWDACVETGAKGSPSKVADYCRYLGVSAPGIEKGPGGVTAWDDAGRTLATREDALGVEYACGVKSFGTGVAGRFSQRAMAALRNDCAREILELTYPITQSVLQAKHDPVDARRRYDMLMGPLRDLWRGRAMSLDASSGEWRCERDALGQPVQASRERWCETFVAMYTSPTASGGMGVDIDPERVRAASMLMADSTDPAAEMRSIEEIAGATVDELAYMPSRERLVEAASDGEDLFAGELTSHFRPYRIRRNLLARTEGDAIDAISPIAKADVLEPEDPIRAIAAGPAGSESEPEPIEEDAPIEPVAVGPSM